MRTLAFNYLYKKIFASLVRRAPKNGGLPEGGMYWLDWLTNFPHPIDSYLNDFVGRILHYCIIPYRVSLLLSIRRKIWHVNMERSEVPESMLARLSLNAELLSIIPLDDLLKKKIKYIYMSDNYTSKQWFPRKSNSKINRKLKATNDSVRVCWSEDIFLFPETDDIGSTVLWVIEGDWLIGVEELGEFTAL